jgi:LytR cell envelope-related transcriptional attenuator
MNSSTPGQRRGAHRTRRDITAALVPALLAVVAVAALITAINVWRGQESDGLGDSTTTGTSSSASPSSTGTSGASAGATASGAASNASDDETTRSSESSESSSTASGSGDGSGDARDFDVVVLNQTSRGGLAAVAADRLRQRGWTVTGVGNFTGVVPATTVYYPPGAEAAAQAAAESLPTPARTRPRFGNLSTSRLTVVLTDNYPS